METDRRLVSALADRRVGDVHPLNVPLPLLADRQRRVAGERWAMVDEVHGTAVVDVDAALGSCGRGAMPAVLGRGDIMVTSRPQRRLGVWVADCAPIAVVGDGGTLLAMHAGWAGLAAGIVDAALDLLADRGERPVEAVRGPVIGPCCYEFGLDDLERVAAAVGRPAPEVTGRTREGTTALDVPAAVRAALQRRGITPLEIGGCTSCRADRWYSHRRRGEAERHALVVWTVPR